MTNQSTGYFKSFTEKVLTEVNKVSDWLLSYVPSPIKNTVSAKLEETKDAINYIYEKYIGKAKNNNELPQQEEREEDEFFDAKEYIEETNKRLAEDGNRVKKFKATGNLNFDLTKEIMKKIKPKIEMRTRVIHAFSCRIYRAKGEIVEYSKTFKSNRQATFAKLADVEEYIHQCEQKRLDLEDSETWSKAYLPPTMVSDFKGVYEGRVLFLSVDTKLISSNEPHLGFGPLPA